MDLCVEFGMIKVDNTELGNSINYGFIDMEPWEKNRY